MEFVYLDVWVIGMHVVRKKCIEHCGQFYVLLTIPGMILVNNQLDTQFVIYVCFSSLHVSGSRVPIIRRIIV